MHFPISGNTLSIGFRIDSSKPEAALDAIIKATSDPTYRDSLVKTGEHGAGKLDLTFYPYNNLEQISQKAMQANGVDISEGTKNILTTNLECNSDYSREYGFTGRIRIKMNGRSILYETNFTDGLRFEFIEEGEIKDDDGNIYRGKYSKFNLGRNIIDPTEFRGTSGAPILGPDHEIVAFVAFGKTGEPYIYGIPTGILKTLIDVDIMNTNDE